MGRRATNRGPESYNDGTGGIRVECSRCQSSEETKRMQNCPICKKPVCQDCLYFVGGKGFCSKGCGEYFFHGEGDEDLTEED
jgi:hypothetical protein